MNKLFTKVAALTLGVAMAAGVGVALGSAKVSEAKAADVTDTLTADKFAATNTTYTDFTNVSFTSSAVYAGNNAKTSSGGIQLRSKNSNSGIVTTVSGGNLKSISITVESGSNKLDVYGKTTAYTAASDLYNSGTQGTKIGSASETGSITLTNPSNYTYVGLRSNNGALYITNITIVWTTSQEGPTALDTPTLTKTDGTLSWTAVTNAASYELTVDGAVVYSGSNTTFSLSSSQMAHGKHSASIVAKPASTDTEHKDSLAGETSWLVFDHAGTADDPYTVADAILAIDEGVTGTKYVTGVVKEIVTPYNTQYSNITFNFVDNVTDTAFMQAYRCGGTEAANVAVGDTVVVSGSLKKHSSTYELDSGCQIVSRVSPQVDTKYTVTFNSNGGTDPEAKEVGEGLVFTFPSAGTKEGYVFKGWTDDGGAHYYQENDTSAPVNADTTYDGEWQTKGTKTNPYNVAWARSAITFNAGVRGVYTTGIVKEIVTPYDSGFKNITFNIVDAAEDTDYLQVFRCKGDDASKVAVGDIVVVSGNLKLHDSTPEYDANCVLESLVTPVTDWTTEQENAFKANLDEFVPEFFGAPSNFNAEDGVVSFDLEGDKKSTVDKYFTDNNWDKDGDYYRHVTVGGHGVVEGTAQTSGSTPQVVDKTTVTFTYHEYYVVTVVEGEGEGQHSTPTNVPSGDSFKLPSPTESYIPEGKEFSAWSINDQEYDIGYEYQVTAETTVTAVYVDKSWSAADKQALETALHGYLPPYFGELVEPLSTTENGATFTVSGDHSDEFATKLGDGWVAIDTKNYVKQGDNYYLTASIYIEQWRLPVGDYSIFSFTYREGQLVNKYSVTYDAGQGTGEDIVINDVEEGSLHALKTFAETQFVAPEGQQFKGWQVGNDAELRAAGYEFTVNGDVTVTAIYEDIPAPTDWSETFKTTFQSRFETTYLPPFVNAEFANESNQTWVGNYPYCKIEVEGNFYSNAATLFNNDSNWYFLGYDEYDCPIFMSADQAAFVIIDVYMKVEAGPVYTSLTFECVRDYAVVTTGAKTEYFVGDNLELTNVKLCAQLLDGTIVNNLTIPQSYWSVSPTTLTEAGDAVVITITVAALQEDFTYNVKVTPVMVESISISGELSKTEYTEGDAWDATGLVATAHYNNGAEEDVTAQVSWTFQPEETVAGTDSVSVVATLGEISSEAANFDVVVNEPVPTYDADAFAKDLLEMVAPICNNYDGKKNNKVALKGVWDTMSQRYSTLSDEEKAKVIAAAAKTDGTDLEKAMAFYNYACKKYGLAKFIEGRQVKALVAEHEAGNSILPIVVIVASSVVAITAIGVVIALKRRKALLAK